MRLVTLIDQVMYFFVHPSFSVSMVAQLNNLSNSPWKSNRTLYLSQEIAL